MKVDLQQEGEATELIGGALQISVIAHFSGRQHQEITLHGSDHWTKMEHISADQK